MLYLRCGQFFDFALGRTVSLSNQKLIAKQGGKMRRFQNISGLILLMILLISSSLFAEEQITITTYYPSPYGIYKELRSQRMAIGDVYYDPQQYCWRDSVIGGCGVIDPGNTDVDLVVEGRVSIGDESPPSGHKLYVTSSSCEPPGLCSATDAIIFGNAASGSSSIGVAGSSANNYGVAGRTLSADPTRRLAGVYGKGGPIGVKAEGGNQGVYAEIDGSSSGGTCDTTQGVWGVGGTYGVQGNGSIAGVYGVSDTGAGVYGYSDTAAGYFNGPVVITGTINPQDTTQVYRVDSSQGYSKGGIPGIKIGVIPYTFNGINHCLKVRGGIVVGTGIYPDECGALPD